MVLCHFLSALQLMKKVAERIFIAPPIWILTRCNHSLLNKSCVVVHQVDDVGMVLGVLVLKSVALYHLHLFKRELHRLNPFARLSLQRR